MRPSSPALHPAHDALRDAKTTGSGLRPAVRPLRPAARCAARVLVVDEENDWAQFVAHGLRRHGHAAVVADSVERALFLAGVQRFDLLVTNVALPDGSGMTLLKKLRDMLPNIRAVAISAGEADQGVVSAAGFEFFLKKPTPIAAISRAVTTLL